MSGILYKVFKATFFLLQGSAEPRFFFPCFTRFETLLKQCQLRTRSQAQTLFLVV